MIYLFDILLLLVYAFTPADVMLSAGVTSDCIAKAFCYHFFHASWLHLGLNILSLTIIFEPIYNHYIARFGYINKLLFIFYAYAGATLAGMMTAVSTPTVGVSGIIFFLMGVLLMLFPNMRMLKNYIYVFIAIAISIYFGKSNVALHIVSFIIGCLFVIIRTFHERRRIYTY